MRNQTEIIYVVLFLTIAILIILLSFYALTYNYNQNIVFNRFTSLSTLSNYFLGYLQTLLTQESYAESYLAGTNGWGKENWASYPYGCILPQSCQNAIQYYNNLLTSGYQTLLTFGEQYLTAYQYYYPYNVSFNFSNNYQAGIFGDCNNIISGEYNYNFPVYVQGLYINITGPSSGSIIPYASTSNITNNPAFYLYNLAYQFSQNGDFSECSYQDCSNALNNNPTYTCAQEFEQFSNDPNIQCNETIIPYQCVNIPLCQICLYPQEIACRVILKCSDNQYNVYYNGNTYPQTISITSIVFYENITNQYYLNCVYDCTEVYNSTSKQIISQSCTLENQQYSCTSQSGCGNLNTNQQNNEVIYTFQYYYSIPIQCYMCIIGGQQCPACLLGQCPNNPTCPENINFPNECVPQPSS
ncbi:Uncharacterized protein Nst1_658 [Candidatus Nanobsidianus stetteri]|uniref:Transmembrane protein n=1 Tax=Nanobsidianus stetteri TaxID=1294122 RepID=R1G2D8_NANST|nr:Uncharacterized protein Nst1_658 [Candidatus Nanobsidianus stetteri]